jgi:hypothetical protein
MMAPQVAVLLGEEIGWAAGKVAAQAPGYAQWLFDGDNLDYTSNNNDLTASGGATFSNDVPYTSSICPVISIPSPNPPGVIIDGSVFINGSAVFN